PFVFGFFVLIPPQTWFGGRFNSGYTASFWTYITSGRFLVWNLGPGGDFYGGFGIGHLWFILFLLVLSFVALPLVLWGRTERGRGAMQRWARRLAKPAWWLLPAVVLWFVEGLPDLAGKNPFYYLAWFVLGYIVMSDEAFAESAVRNWWVAFGLGVAGTAASVASGAWRDSLPDPSWPLTIANIGGMLAAWLVVVGLLGLGKRMLDKPSPVLSYLAEASYPVYILHQTVIVVAAFYIVRLAIPWPLQWVMLFLVAAGGTFALYEGIRRLAPLRFLFGMRPKRRPSAAEAASVAS
ncbi:MAG TPA: acyltransferase family protein, partial [Coriobacteriia bacterium]